MHFDEENEEEIEEFLNSLPPEILDSIHLDEFDQQQSIAISISQCILGVVGSLIPLLLKSIGAAAIQFAINSSFCKLNDHPPNTNIFVHSLNAFVGFCLFIAHSWPHPQFISNEFPLLLYFVSSCVLIKFLSSNDFAYKGTICILFTIFFIIACQMAMEPTNFLTIRGPWMIAAMKQISFCIDLDSINSLQSPSLISQFAYIFDPCTLLFGPFITFQQFQKMPVDARKRAIGSKSLLFIQFLHFCRHFLLAFLFLLFSTCLFDPNNSLAFHLFSPSMPSILRYFLMAFAFRSSHYFICHFSSALAILGGHSPNQMQIVQWKAIEWPQSMAQVATNWNVPMHNFLHKYIYSPNIAQFGVFNSVLLTFVVSAALHGLDLQMAAVLLSLGVFAIVEKIFRHKLASFFSICIRVKDFPEGKCPYRRKKNHVASILLRLLFIANNIFLLIYLGAPFHGEGQFHGYTFGHLLHIWANQFLLSGHLIGLSMLIAAFAIPSSSSTMQKEKEK